MSDTPLHSQSQWCLVGNIIDERPYGEGGAETRRGTKHFAPGTKVYCLPPQWGDGYEQIAVIGRHRGSRRLVSMIISASWVTNWRAKVIYDPTVLRMMAEAYKADPWASKEYLDAWVKELRERDGNFTTNSSS